MCHTPKPLWIFLHQPIETRERKIGEPDMVAGKFPQSHRVRGQTGRAVIRTTSYGNLLRA
jgi:hypothetical protein